MLQYPHGETFTEFTQNRPNLYEQYKNVLFWGLNFDRIAMMNFAWVGRTRWDTPQSPTQPPPQQGEPNPNGLQVVRPPLARGVRRKGGKVSQGTLKIECPCTPLQGERVDLKNRPFTALNTPKWHGIFKGVQNPVKTTV